MANFTGRGRTSYFAVRDPGAFRAAVESLEVQLITREQDGQQLVALLDANVDGGGWPTCAYDEDDEPVDVDVGTLISEHIASGWVAIVQEVGWEKHRYLHGSAYAVNAAGDRRWTSIDDIPGLEDLGERWTDATY